MKAKKLLVVVAAALLSFVGLAECEAFDIHSADFSVNDGAYVASTFNPLEKETTPGPWIYGATGTGGSNAWSAAGGVGGPYEHLLTSPEIAVPDTGPYALEFDHSYLMEGAWDGGVVMISVNGAPFTQVTSFVQNGYNDLMQDNDDLGYEGDLNGVPMFSADSEGLLHSAANLGTLTAGDTLQVQFRGGWDWGYNEDEAAVDWTIESVSVSAGVIPEPGTLVMLLGLGVLGAIGLVRRGRK